MSRSAPEPIRRLDYLPPAYGIPEIALTFDLAPSATRVSSRLTLERAPDTPADAPLVLDGEAMTLKRITVDGEALSTNRYTVDEARLTIAGLPDRCVLEIETEIDPAANTRLEGLYLTNGRFCTQCEAEGFRRITYFPDRPDVMARFRTEIRADRAAYPVLLSNGNLVETRDLPDGRHAALWDDPFPKPAYLFALVAGALDHIEDRYVTRSGRTVTLRIYTEPGQTDQCAYAMDSLKRSMAWDEETYGLEYDLDLFMIVAVGDFNMGAMENKGLNIFNARLILARPDTATDTDYANIESVVAHEYFHNWTGNRVTCRDWFQLSLKEGLTVYRDQEFTSDVRSRAVKRIADARLLRTVQFAEDAGPTAHSVRPDSYIEVNNFYTVTIYEKGAELIRMIATLIGVDAFKRGLALYLDRHDGTAATIEDFVVAMEEAGGLDLSQFRRWYGQAGTPELRARGTYDAGTRRYRLTLSQTVPPTPGQPSKQPMHLPVALGLVGPDGADIPLHLEHDPEGTNGATTRVLSLKEAERTYVFSNVPAPPVPSLLRGLSAPVRLEQDADDADLAFLLASDSDSFNRWDAGQQLAARVILKLVSDHQEGRDRVVPDHLLDALEAVLVRNGDPALTAQILELPSEADLGQRMTVVDVEAIHLSRETVRRALAARAADRLAEIEDRLRPDGPYSPDAGPAAQRRLANIALAYLATLDTADTLALCRQRYAEADNMTDSIAALSLLADRTDAAADEALADFERRWQDNPLVLDKWFTLQALSKRPDTLERVQALTRHPRFDRRNPNRMRSLIGAFTAANQRRFHQADGAGYRLLADEVCALDGLNPQVAARLLNPLGQWRRFDTGRQALMRQALDRVMAEPDLSRDVYEIASKSLMA